MKRSAMLTSGLGRADLHMHTTSSDGRDGPTAVVEHCRRTQALDVIAVTDHDTLDGALRAAEYASRFDDAPAVIVGAEISSTDGHILGLFLERPVARGLSAQKTVYDIHEQGGLAVAAHPFWHSDRRRPQGVGNLVKSVQFDGVEVLNGGLTPGMILANRRALTVSQNLGCARVGASDAHVCEAIGWGHTAFAGSSAGELRAAILAATVAPGRMPIGLRGVGRYFAWGLELGARRAPRPVAS